MTERLAVASLLDQIITLFPFKLKGLIRGKLFSWIDAALMLRDERMTSNDWLDILFTTWVLIALGFFTFFMIRKT